MIQNSIFGNHSRFHWDFHIQFDKPSYWHSLASRYEHWLSSSNTIPIKVDKIPKIIHQIWLGPNPLPPFYEKFARSGRKLNSDYEYRLWTDKDLEHISLQNLRLFNSLSNYGAKSDVLRYEILNLYGGVYVDVDFECMKAIPSALLPFDFVGGLQFSSVPEVGNAFLMAAPQSFIISSIISQCSSPDHEGVFEIFKATGPFLVSKIIEENLNSSTDEFLILPSNYVYPLPSFLSSMDVSPYSFITPQTFAMHYWNLSWLPIPNFSLITLIKKVVKRLLFLN